MLKICYDHLMSNFENPIKPDSDGSIIDNGNDRISHDLSSLDTPNLTTEDVQARTRMQSIRRGLGMAVDVVCENIAMLRLHRGGGLYSGGVTLDGQWSGISYNQAADQPYDNPDQTD